MAAQIHKPPTGLIAVAVVGGLLALLLGAIALGQYARFAMQDELDRKVLTRPSPELSALREREAAHLGTYQWVDKKSGVLRIPVDRALELTLAERRAR